MGAKFFRGADKPKKFRKRLSQNRSWFRTFKWVACKYSFESMKEAFNNLRGNEQILIYVYDFRSRTSTHDHWSSIQGYVG